VLFYQSSMQSRYPRAESRQKILPSILRILSFIAHQLASASKKSKERTQFGGQRRVTLDEPTCGEQSDGQKRKTRGATIGRLIAAKAQLSKLIEHAMNGEEVIIPTAQTGVEFDAVSVTLVGDTGDQLEEKSRPQKASHWPFSLR
jgi:hypothetical protein